MIETGFNQDQQEALALLFENYWIIREKEPKAYLLIRENEKALRQFISGKFGFSFIIHTDFIKLEKIPHRPKPWMGLQDFQEPQDYALFSCGLAYLEKRSMDDQFLLSEFITEIEEIYPGMLPLDWTNYQHRKSLIRAVKKLLEFSCIREVDSQTGGLDEFAHTESQEVLYQATIFSRYFMRNHAHSLKEFNKVEEILDMEEDQQTNLRQIRTYRKLMFEPVMFRENQDDEDFDYIRRYRNRVRDDFEAHTPLELQVTKNAAMLTLPEANQLYTAYPDRKGISLVSLHTQAYIRENIDDFKQNPFGEIRLTRPQFEQVIEQIKSEYGQGWSAEYREKSSLKKITDDVLTQFTNWSFSKMEPETGLIVLLPTVGRMIGQYPEDFNREE